jgi:hypothetical protein
LFGSCTPKIEGGCSKDSDCASRRCAQGLCLAAESGDGGGDAGPGDAGSDAGDDGGTSDAGCLGPGCHLGLVIEAPAPNTVVRPTFHVKAQASSSEPPDDVTFELTAAAGGSSLGTLVVTQAGPGLTYEGDLAATATAGSAVLTATVHAGVRKLSAGPIALLIDGVAPQIDTTWDGSQWRSATGTFTVPATVSDDNGVASAQLVAQLADGGVAFYDAALAGGDATFTVPAADLVVPGAAAAIPFGFVVTDQAGNSTERAFASFLRVDDEKPSVSAVADTLWHGTTATIVATAGDGAGSGLAAISLSVNGAAPLQGTVQDGSASFQVSIDSLAPPGFEGPVPFQATATDAVGNSSSSGGVLLVDRAPPAVSSLLLISEPDRQPKWYRARGASDLIVQAAFDAGSGSPIDPASLSLSGGGVSVGRDPGKPDYTFDLPRDAGIGIEGPVAFTVAGSDLAGNVGSAQLAIWFDDLPPQLGGAASLPDGGTWVARRQPDGGAAFPEVDVVATDQGVGVAAITLYSVDGGAALSDGGAVFAAGKYAMGLDLRNAAAGAAASFPFLATAVDQFGNAASAAYSVSVDDSPPAITQPNADQDKSWHSGLPGSTTSQVTVIATIDDQGSGVFAPPALALPDGGVVSTAHLLAGGDAKHGRWQYDAFSAPADAALDGTITLTATAVDGVGNVGASGQAIQVNVDNIKPVLGAPSFNADGSGYFRGPSVALQGDPTTLDVALPVTESHLASAAATLPDAGVVAGQLQLDGKVHFAIPRAIGSGGGKKTVPLSATDMAGNSAQTSVDLLFEDAPPSLNGVADSTWYAQANAAIPASVTLTALPPSGVASAALDAGTAPTCKGAGSASADGKTYTFHFPGSCAPAATEGPYGVTMMVTSGAGVAASASTQLRIDGAGPTVQVESIQYPGSVPPPLNYSHDGSHFNLREGNVGLVSFLTWDCGAGLAANPLAGYGVAGNPSKSSASCQSTALAASCTNGATPTKTRCTVSANLATASKWAYPLLNNLVSVSIAANDVFGNQGNGSTNVNVTRRLWRSADNALKRAAVGPPPYVYTGGTNGVFAFDRNNGNGMQWTGSRVVVGPAVSPNGGDPLVYWADGSAPLLQSASAGFTLTPRSSCDLSSGSRPADATLDGPQALVILDDARAATSNTWTEDVTTCTTTCTCGGDAPVCAHCIDDTGARGCKECTTNCTTTTNTGTQQFAMGTNGCEASPVPYVPANTVLGHGFAYWGGLTASSLSSTTTVSTSAATSHIIVFGWTDGDAIAGDDGLRHDFNGAWIAPVSLPQLSWPFSVTGFGSLIVGNMAGNWGVQSVDGVAMGNALAAASTSVAPIIDVSTDPALVYLASPASGGSVLAAPLTTNSGLGSAQFSETFGTPIDDMVLGADGSLVVISAGTVAVIVTDSPGVGTGSGGLNAWPAPGRDACKSFNLDFACTY